MAGSHAGSAATVVGSLVLVAIFLLPSGPLSSSAHSMAPPRPATLHILTASLPENLSWPDYPASTNWATYDANGSRSGAAANESILSPSDAKGLSEVWASNTTGPIEGSLVVVNGTAYLGAWDARGVYAFNASSGAFLWNISAGGGWLPGASNSSEVGACTQGFFAYDRVRWTGITSTPAVADGLLYVAGGNNTLFAFRLNATSPGLPPTPVWSTDLANSSSGVWQAHYLWGSPLVYDGSVYIGEASGCEGPISGQLFQLDALNGSIEHIFTTVPDGQWGGAIWSTPAVDPTSNAVFITTGNEYTDNCSANPNPPGARAIIALNASNVSQELGHLQVGTACIDADFGAGTTLYTLSNGTPMLLAANKDGNAYAAYLSSFSGNASLSGPAWSVGTVRYDKSPAAFGGGRLFVAATTSISALDPGNGTAEWTSSETNYTLAFPEAGLTYANGLLIAGLDWYNFSGSTLVVLDASTGALLYSRNFSGLLINGQPVVSDGRLLVPTGPTALRGAGWLFEFATENLTVHPTFSLNGTVGGESAPDGVVPVAIAPGPTGGMPGYSCRVDWGDGMATTGCGPLGHDYAVRGLFTSAHSIDGTVQYLDFGGARREVRFTLTTEPNGTVRWSSTVLQDLEFVESGLPIGSSWSASVDGVSATSSGRLLTFFEPAGSHTYRIGTIPGYYVLSTGAVDVASSDVVVDVRFTPPPKVSLGPSGGSVGISTVVSGSWFAPHALIALNWSGAPIGCTSGRMSADANGSFSCVLIVPPSPAGSADLVARDAPGDVANASFEVAPSLLASSDETDVGANLSLMGSGFAAGSGWTVLWNGTRSIPCSGPSPSISAVGAFQCNLTVPSDPTGSVRVEASDSSSPSPDRASTSVTVEPDPTVNPPIPSRASADVGQSVRFTALAGNGSGSYRYGWSGLPVGCLSISSATIDCEPATAGTYQVRVEVTDRAGVTIASDPLTFPVFDDPSVSNLTIAAPTLDLGQSLWVSAVSAGGSGGTVYTWSGLPVGCASSSSVLDCIPKLPGGFTVGLTETDSNGVSASSASLTIVVYSDPTIGPPRPSVASIDVGQSVGFQDGGSDGSGGYRFAWSGLPAGCLGTSTASVDCPSFPVAGSFSITVRLTDSDGVSVESAALAFLVEPDPSVTVPTASAGSTDVGEPVVFHSSGSGGSGEYRYTWSGLPGGCAGTGEEVECTPTSAGPLSISVSLTDSNGGTASSVPLPFEVYDRPAPSSVLASVSETDVGGSIAVSTTLKGAGAGPDRATWSASPAGLVCGSDGSLTTVCDAEAPGTYDVGVSVFDANGESATAPPVIVLVRADPVLLGPTVSRPVVDAGGSITGSANLTLGTGPYEFRWHGLPNGCDVENATFDCAPEVPGDYAISVVGVDASGASVASRSVLLVVNPPIAVSISASSTAPVEGADLELAAVVAGGTPAYSYAWDLGDDRQAIGEAVVHGYAAAGEEVVTVNVTDAAGGVGHGVVVVDVRAPPASPGTPVPWVAAIGAIAFEAAAIALLLLRRPSRGPRPSRSADPRVRSR